MYDETHTLSSAFFDWGPHTFGSTNATETAGHIPAPTG